MSNFLAKTVSLKPVTTDLYIVEILLSTHPAEKSSVVPVSVAHYQDRVVHHLGAVGALAGQTLASWG